jgi:hypothetical protein
MSLGSSKLNTPFRRAKIQTTDTTTYWQKCEATRTVIHCSGNAKWDSHFRRQFGTVLLS